MRCRKPVWYIFLWAFGALFAGSCKNSSYNLRIKGSDTEVNLAAELAESFYSVHPEFTVSVSGGGSGLGIAALLNEQADIANSSRPLYEDEIKMFKEQKIDLKTIVFAQDATAIIVNDAIPFNEMDVATLAGIFSGKIANWKSIGGPDLPINIYGRQSSSGTHSFIQKKLGIKFSSKAKEMNGNAQIIEGVKMDRSGIGYVGAGYILENKDNQTKVIAVKKGDGDSAILPTDSKAIIAGKYYLQRPLYQFIPAGSWHKAKVFIDFEKSPAGQKLIEKSGYYVIE